MPWNGLQNCSVEQVNFRKQYRGSVSELATLLYCCTASACSADGVEFGLDLDEFCDLIGPEDMERMSTGIRAEESGDEGSKKKPRE